MEADAAPQAIVDRIKGAATRFNESKKGRKRPVKTVGEVFQSVGAKWFKDDSGATKTQVKTKDAVGIITVKNDLSL